MLIPASPSVEEKRADEARLVEIGDVDHRGAELRVHADALDVDDARAAVGEHRAGHGRVWRSVSTVTVIRLS